MNINAKGPLPGQLARWESQARAFIAGANARAVETGQPDLVVDWDKQPIGVQVIIMSAVKAMVDQAERNLTSEALHRQRHAQLDKSRLN